MSSLIDTAFSWWRHEARSGESTEVNQPVPVVEQPGKQTRVVPLEPPWLAQMDRAGLPRTLVYPSMSLSRLLDQNAERFGDATAIVYNHRKWTWLELREQTNRLAGGLAHLGVRRGERVILTLPNCPEFIISFFAILKLGAVVVNVGPLMGADDLLTVFTLTSPRVVIGLDLQSPILCRAGKDSTVEHWVWVTLAFYQSVFKRIGYNFKLWHERDPKANREQHTTLKKVMADAPARPPTVPPDLDRPALLQPTGGTTGTVKLVQLSHRNLLSNAAQVSAWMQAQYGQERVMAVLPMFHVYGLTVGLLSGMYLAAELILETRFGASETVELVRRYKPSIFPIVPAMCDALCDELEKQHAERGTPTRLDGLRVCISGAAPLTAATSDRFMRITGAMLIEGYGLSEAGPVTHANLAGQPRIGTIGLPMPDTLCRIVDIETGTTDVIPGDCGEMLVSGPQVMSGYFSSPELNRKVLTTDEQGRVWLHTADIVRMDAEGFFHVQDRKKDMIIRSGMKVYPAKVEKVLTSHEQIIDAGVIGRPDTVHTEEVTAYVVPKVMPENREEFAAALRAFCRQHLAPYEVPAKIEFLEKLPRSALGKLLKKDLRVMLPIGSQESPAGETDPKTPSPNKPEPQKNREPERGRVMVAWNTTNGEVAIVAGARTPWAKAGTALREVHVAELAQRAMKEALYRSGWPADQLDEVMLGNVIMPADATNLARVAALYAGAPFSVPGLTLQRNCASGMEAIAEAAGRVRNKSARAVLAGGAESMSTLPLLLPSETVEPMARLSKARSVWAKANAITYLRPRHFRPIAALEQGLTDPTCNMIMGKTAEVLAHEFGITRKEQDEFAVRSHHRAAEAEKAGRFNEERVPFFAGKKFEPVVEDVGPRPNQSLEALGNLKPIFDRRDGTVTVGNSCQVTDGAAAMLVVDGETAKARNLPVLGHVRAYAYAGLDPARMGLGPVYAIAGLLKQTGMQLSDIGLLEINEAFAAQVLACLKAMASDDFCQEHLNRNALGEVDPDKLNVNGGAIALGHPGRGDRRAAGADAPARDETPRRSVRRRRPLRRRRARRRDPAGAPLTVAMSRLAGSQASRVQRRRTGQ